MKYDERSEDVCLLIEYIDSWYCCEKQFIYPGGAIWFHAPTSYHLYAILTISYIVRTKHEKARTEVYKIYIQIHFHSMPERAARQIEVDWMLALKNASLFSGSFGWIGFFDRLSCLQIAMASEKGAWKFPFREKGVDSPRFCPLPRTMNSSSSPSPLYDRVFIVL